METTKPTDLVLVSDLMKGTQPLPQPRPPVADDDENDGAEKYFFW